MKRNWLAVSIVSGIGLCKLAGAATAENTGNPETTPPAPELADVQPADALGASFENQAAGISLRIPAGCHRIQSTGAGDDIGQFGDEKRQWQLKLTRISRPTPTPLTAGSDNFAKPVPGLMDQTIAQLKRDLSGCTILRQDLTNIGDGDPKIKDNVGMIAVRYTAAGGHYLSQQAIIQANPRLFYLLSLTTPAGDARANTGDPLEANAVETFRQMLDSVHLLDTRKLKLDQDERFFRTRTLMLNWKKPARLKAVLVPQQWLRVLKNGRDIGYSYITEQTADGIPKPLTREELKEVKAGTRSINIKDGDGILIGLRTRSFIPPLATEKSAGKGPIQVDTADWLFLATDRNLEDWSRMALFTDESKDKAGKSQVRQTEEFGASTIETHHTLDKSGAIGTPEDDQQPPVRVTHDYVLNVTSISNSGAAEPVVRDLPPFYLPQALNHLLPRLLPLQRPKGYLFATYVPEMKEVMLRYVDVGKEQDVTFAGKKIVAVPISDRIGWHGSVTTHYMSPDGKYLGSENKDSHVVILPTDGQTLLSIWKNANLSQPAGVEKPTRK